MGSRREFSGPSLESPFCKSRKHQNAKGHRHQLPERLLAQTDFIHIFTARKICNVALWSSIRRRPLVEHSLAVLAGTIGVAHEHGVCVVGDGHRALVLGLLACLGLLLQLGVHVWRKLVGLWGKLMWLCYEADIREVQARHGRVVLRR
jgi:hypothetical protein